MVVVLEPVAFASAQDPKRPTPYPDPAVEVVDPRFCEVSNPKRSGRAIVHRCTLGSRVVWMGDGGYLL